MQGVANEAFSRILIDKTLGLGDWNLLDAHQVRFELNNVSKAQSATPPIEVQPLSLQKEFAEGVTEIRELEAGQATWPTRLDALFRSMLHRAFNGDF